MQTTYNQNAQKRRYEMCSGLSNGSELQKMYDEEDQTLFYDAWNGHFNKIHYPESDRRSPFVELEPMCEFERACKKIRLDRSLECIRMSQVLTLYYELMNEEEDEKTVQALLDCEAIWIYPGYDDDKDLTV